MGLSRIARIRSSRNPLRSITVCQATRQEAGRGIAIACPDPTLSQLAQRGMEEDHRLNNTERPMRGRPAMWLASRTESSAGVYGHPPPPGSTGSNDKDSAGEPHPPRSPRDRRDRAVGDPPRVSGLTSSGVSGSRALDSAISGAKTWPSPKSWRASQVLQIEQTQVINLRCGFRDPYVGSVPAVAVASILRPQLVCAHHCNVSAQASSSPNLSASVGPLSRQGGLWRKP